MRCNSVQNISFTRALPTSKKADYAATLKEAKRSLGISDGLSLMKIDGAAMPSLEEEDTGVGKLNSQIAADFINYMSFYTGANAFKVFPFGQPTRTFDNSFIPYLKTAITTGEDYINLFNLASSKYGNILDKKDAKEFVDSNRGPQNRIDYENEFGQDIVYPISKPLRKAWENFKLGKSTPALEQEFEEFKADRFVEENYTRLALYPHIGYLEPDLFVNFENDPAKQAKFEQYKKEYADDIDFFKFKQFIAQKEFREGKERINANGQKLFGDCLIGFSSEEIWAHPDAFMPNTSIGLYSWGLPALKFDEILEEGSPANSVFRDKISFFLKNYDGIRFDVGWCYAIARTENDEHIEQHFDMGHKLFDFIEDTAREIKGEDFDTQNLIYEMDGFDKMFDWSTTPPIPLENIRNIVSVLTTEHEHPYEAGWGNPTFLEKAGLDEDEFIIGTNNHDGANLKKMSDPDNIDSFDKLKDSALALSKALNIPFSKIFLNPKEFVKAKFAELFTTKNQFFFFIDALGSDYNDDDHTRNPENYRFRVDRDYERQYHSALQNNDGLNTMEAIKMVMKSRNIDKTNPALYGKVAYWADYLRQKGAKTEQEANEEERLGLLV